MATVILPVSCDDHEVHAILEHSSWLGVVDVHTVVALFCSDCQVEYPAE